MPTTYWAFPTQTFTAWDANGDPVASAEAKIFEAGTSTPLVVYTDTGLTTPHAVPQVADGNGVFAPVYISGADEIKIEVRTPAGALLPGYPVDNITGTPVGGLTSSGVVFVPTSTLASTEVQNALETLDTLTQRTRIRLIEAETAGSSNAYTLDAPGTITAYADGDIFVLRANRNNTGAATLNVDSVGAKDWKRHDGSSYVVYATGEIRDGNHYWVEFDSSSDEFRTIFEMRRVATQAEAEAGTAVAVGMDALRVKQAIDANRITRKTKQTTTSGTTKTFTSILSGASRITFMLEDVSMSGTDTLRLRIGDAGGIETSGYEAGAAVGTSSVTSTAAFILAATSGATVKWSGNIVFNRLDGNTWVSGGNLNRDGSNIVTLTAGTKSLSSELTQIELTTTGSDTFDSGQINILVE